MLAAASGIHGRICSAAETTRGVAMKREKKRPSTGRNKNLLKAIGVLAIGAGASLAHLPDAQAYQVAISSGDEATLEQFLRDHPTSLYAPDVIGRLSFGVPKSDTALPEMILAKNNGNGGGNGGGKGNGNGGGHGGGNGNSGAKGNGDGGNAGGGNGNGNAGGGNSGSKSGSTDTDGDTSGSKGGLGQSNGGHGRFHGADDTGRPDMFGDHGQPDIGPPGQSGY